MTDDDGVHALRKGGQVLAVVATVYVGSLIGRGPFIDPATSPAAFAETMANPKVIASGLAYVAAMALQTVAVFYIARAVRSKSPGATEAAVVGTIGALFLTTAIVGPFVFIYPAIAKSYLAGNANALDIVKSAANPLFLGSIVVEGLGLTIASIFLAIALRRSGIKPWIGITYALGALLYSTPIPGFAAEIIGSVLLLASGVGLAKTPSAE
jgi:hypothetical protein